MDRKIREIYLCFSDMHLGERQKNNLEYFEAEKEYVRSIALAMQKYHGEKLVLCLLGDTFDFLTVQNEDGKTHAEANEEATIEQIHKIWKAHRRIFAIWRTFLRQGGTIKFFIGNHDLALAFANVQNYIRNRLVKYMSHVERMEIWDKRIKFVFEETKDGVFFTHGNEAEYIHYTPPEKVFLTKRRRPFGWLFGRKSRPLIPPLLRHPYGNHSRADLANTMARGTRFCRGNYWVGRLEPHAYIYLESIWKNWRFGLRAFFLWLLMPIRHRLSRRWWVRKSAGLIMLFWYNIQLLLWTILNKLRGKDYTEYPKNILKDNDNIDIIILAHIHICRRETHGNYGTYIYPGNWSVTYDVQWPRPEFKWRRFRRLEKFLKTITAFHKMFGKRTRHLYAPKKRELYSFGVCKFFDDGYKEVLILRYNPQNDCIEELN